mmetsp:Transcript_46547/g.145793  ORF Transcript_46547/g.145793 Transcript_46547/m.145793 type:complete len:511 (+) Transcript_46547:46-1578(+)
MLAGVADEIRHQPVPAPSPSRTARAAQDLPSGDGEARAHDSSEHVHIVVHGLLGGRRGEYVGALLDPDSRKVVGDCDRGLSVQVLGHILVCPTKLDHRDCQVVLAASLVCRPDHVLGCLLGVVPVPQHQVYNLLIGEDVVDAVSGQDEEQVLVREGDDLDLGLGDRQQRGLLEVQVPERACHRQALILPASRLAHGVGVGRSRHAPSSPDLQHEAAGALDALLLVHAGGLVILRDRHGLPSPAQHGPRVAEVRYDEPQRGAELWVSMQQCCHGRGAHELELLPLGHVQDLLVRLSEGLPNGRLDLLVPRRRLHLLLPEVVHDVLVELLGGVVRHLRPAVPVKDAEVDAQLLHGLVRDVTVLKGLLQAWPALSVHPEAQGLGGDVVALLLLLQRLRVGMDGQRLPIDSQHHDLQGAGPVVLLAGLVRDLPALLEVDGVCRRAADDVLPVHEEALANLLLVPAQRHDETEALVRVPALDPALVARLLRSLLWRRLRLRARRLCGACRRHFLG